MKLLSKGNLLVKAVIFVMSVVPAYACRPDTVPFEYAVQDDQIVWREGGLRGVQPVKHLPELSVKGFHSLQAAVKAVGQVWPDGLSLLQPAYFGDGKYVVWQAVMLQNPPTVAPVDATSFLQPFADSSFAFDAASLYLDGQRTGENPNLDARKIKKLGYYLLTDEQYLIREGRVVGLAMGYRVLSSFNAPTGVMFTCANWPVEVAATIDNIYVNGMPLDVDPAHFKVTRWLPKSGTLYYRDQFGQHVLTVP